MITDYLTSTLNHKNEAANSMARFISDVATPMYACDLNGHITDYNMAAEALWGSAPLGHEVWCLAEEIKDESGRTIAMTNHPMANAVKTGVAQAATELQLRLPGGIHRYVLAHASPVFNDAGKVTGAMNILVDITSYKRIDETPETQLKEISGPVPDLVYQFKLEADKTMWFPHISQGSKSLLGIPPEGLYDDVNVAFKNIHSLDLGDVVECINVSAKTLSLFFCEFRIINAVTKSVKWIRAASMPKKLRDGSILWNGTMTDITVNKAAETKLKLTRRAIENAVEGIIITDVTLPDNAIIFANRSFYDLTGYKPQDVIGKNCRFLQGPNTDLATIDVMRKSIERKEIFTVEILNYKKTGEPFWNSLTVVPMMDVNGVVTNYAGFQNDVTQRKLAEAKALAASEELESFNYTVSHDLQSPLRIISAFSKILLNGQRNKLGPEAVEHLEFIENSAKQMSALVKGLLAFSKQGKAALTYGHVNLDEQVQQVVAELKMQVSGGGKLKVIQQPLGYGVCDRELLKQVWVNLIGNAIKYSSKKALACIEIGLTENPKGAVYFVKDNGAGFNSVNAAKLFRPFQRMHTNEEFEGTGVGLAAVHKIITKHGGQIWAEATEGEGATFYFTLQ